MIGGYFGKDIKVHVAFSHCSSTFRPADCSMGCSLLNELRRSPDRPAARVKHYCSFPAAAAEREKGDAH